MATPVNFIIGIKTLTMTPTSGSPVTPAGLNTVSWNNSDQVQGKAHDDSTSIDSTWAIPGINQGTVDGDDAKGVAALANLSGTLVVTGNNRQTGGKDQIFTFNECKFVSGVSGSIMGGNTAPSAVSITFGSKPPVVTDSGTE